MREVETRLKRLHMVENNLINELQSKRYYEHEIVKFINLWRYGIAFADTNPDWIPINEQTPPHGVKVLVYLDDDTMQTYTYYDNNKELVQLFKNHVIAWMYQPNKPIFKDE